MSPEKIRKVLRNYELKHFPTFKENYEMFCNTDIQQELYEICERIVFLVDENKNLFFSTGFNFKRVEERFKEARTLINEALLYMRNNQEQLVKQENLGDIVLREGERLLRIKRIYQRLEEREKLKNDHIRSTDQLERT